MLGRKSRFWNRRQDSFSFVEICHAWIIMDMDNIQELFYTFFYSKYRIEMKTRRRQNYSYRKNRQDREKQKLLLRLLLHKM